MSRDRRIERDFDPEYTHRHDSYDVQDYQAIRDEIDALPTATAALLDITKTARGAMFDAFALFVKSAPEIRDEEQVRPDHLINRTVAAEAMDLPELRELRRFTRGDVVGAAMAAVKIEPDLEVLFDRAKFRQDQADELQRLQDELNDLLNQVAQQQSGQGQPSEEGGEGEGQGSGQGQGQSQSQGSGQGEQSLQDRIESLKNAIEALKQALKDGLSADALSMRARLAGAMQEATGEARGEAQAAQMCGMDPGQLRRLPAKERLEAAARFNNPKIREKAREFGPLFHLMMSERRKMIDGLPHEAYDQELGNDLSRLTTHELTRLDDDDMSWAFMKDFSQRRLRLKKVRGIDKVGQGGMIYVEDGSGSMMGQKEIAGKCVGCCLGNLAKKEGRRFTWIHFGSEGQLWEKSFENPEDWTLDNLLDCIEKFWGGGTSFATPLTRALEILEKEHAETGRVSADIVFATDGWATLTEEFLEDFLERMHRIEGVCHGINLTQGGETKTEPLNTFCEGRVSSLEDLKGHGKELKQTFRGLSRGRS